MNAKQVEVARRRRSQAEVEGLVGEYEASGLGRLEFCAKHGLSLSTLNRHRKRRQLRSEGATSARLVAVECSAAKQTPACRPGSELSVLLSSGRRIEVPEAAAGTGASAGAGLSVRVRGGDTNLPGGWNDGHA